MPTPYCPPLQTNNQIRQISRLMVLACWTLLLLLPAALVYFWLTTSDTGLAVQSGLPANAVVLPLPTWQRLAAGAVTALPLGLLLMGIWQAKRCFGHFLQGQVFTAHAIGLLRSFAGWVAAATVAAMLAGVLASVLLTLHNPPGMRHLALGISSSHLFALFFAGLVWLMAAIMGQGQSLADENRSFV